jgi:hypothetical protein
MARGNKPDAGSTTTATPRVRKSEADKLRTRIAGILTNMGLAYRDAASAIRVGNEDSYADAMKLVKTYAELHDTFAKKLGDAITAEGLAQAME